MGSAAQAPTSRNGLFLPLDFTGCLASWIDRSRHLLLVLQTRNPGLASSRPPLLHGVDARQAPRRNFARPSLTARQCARSCWRAPPRPASVACAPKGFAAKAMAAPGYAAIAE